MNGSRSGGLETPGRAATLLSVACATGVFLGSAEFLVLFARKWTGSAWLLSDARIVWLAPLSYTLLLVLGTLPLIFLGRLLPRIVRPSAQVFVVLAVGITGFLFIFFPALHQFAILLLALGIASQLAPRMVRLGDAGARRLHLSAVILVLLLAGVAGAMAAGRKIREQRAEAALPSAVKSSPNVLLVVLDAVRARSLGLYGSQYPTSPFLDSLAARGIVFSQAYAAAPWTLPSHASMMTGRYPDDIDAGWTHPLGRRYPTLSEEFAKRGYITGGFVGNVAYTSAETGLNRGFTHYDDYRVTLPNLVVASSLGRMLATNPKLRSLLGFYDVLGRKNARSIVDAFLSWQSTRAERPFFAFLNIYDAHEPYLPAPPFDTAFGLSKNRDRSHIRYLNAQLAERADKLSMTPAQAAEEQRAYGASILWLDRELGRMYHVLDQRHLADHTIIVVVGDHGEQFGEHGLYSHGNSLYGQVLHVPLIFAGPLPLPPGTRIPNAVSLRDLPATLLKLADANRVTRVPGHTLIPIDAGADRSAISPVYAAVEPARNEDSRYPAARGPMRAVVVDGHIYIRHANGTEELYDETADTAEAKNLAGTGSFSGLLKRARLLTDSMRAAATAGRVQPVRSVRK